MRGLFGEIQSEGYPAIVRLWETKTQETVQLEFKQKAISSHGRLEPKDYDNLGITLSAFANSAGGLLIWGVRTEKHGKDQPDAADRGVPIAEVSLFQSELGRAVGEALMPRHDGIEILCVEDPETPGSGYVAIWVERSERRPHRAERAKEKYYYKRVGSSSFAMEHYDIEDAFNRSTPAQLQLVLGTVTKSDKDTTGMYRTFRYTVDFLLKNSSALSACAPYVWIDEVAGGTILQALSPILSYGQFGARKQFSGDAATFVHPGLDVSVFRIWFDVGYYLGTKQWHHDGNPLDTSVLLIAGGFGCQNSRAKALRFEHAVADLVKLEERQS